MILVRNESGVTVPRFGVLGINGVMFDPAVDEQSFMNQVALSGVTPAILTHRGKFIILAEPIADGDIGRAWITGSCPVMVSVSDEAHQFAEVYDGDAARLKSAQHGSARILWKQDGTGELWAIVRLAEENPRTIMVKATSTWSGGGAGADFWTFWAKWTDGTDVFGDAFLIYIPRLHVGEAGAPGDPNVATGNILPVTLGEYGVGAPVVPKWIVACNVIDATLGTIRAAAFGVTPQGWHKLDGTDGYPDTNGRFLVSRKGGDPDFDLPPPSTGGTKSHTQTNPDSHNTNTATVHEGSGAGTDVITAVTGHAKATHDEDPISHLPPYFITDASWEVRIMNV
jgi:hypothetical protein